MQCFKLSNHMINNWIINIFLVNKRYELTSKYNIPQIQRVRWKLYCLGGKSIILILKMSIIVYDTGMMYQQFSGVLLNVQKIVLSMCNYMGLKWYQFALSNFTERHHLRMLQSQYKNMVQNTISYTVKANTFIHVCIYLWL